MGRLILLVAAVLTFGGCIFESSDDGKLTCANFDKFLYDCTANCSPTWDCESNYYSLPVADQVDLDACSDCMAVGQCADCSAPGIPSCWAFMEDFLGVDCW
jgi:hypothetical protein